MSSINHQLPTGADTFWIKCVDDVSALPIPVPFNQVFVTEAGTVTQAALDKAHELESIIGVPFRFFVVHVHSDCAYLKPPGPPPGHCPWEYAEDHLQRQYSALVKAVFPPDCPYDSRSPGGTWIQGWIVNSDGVFEPRTQRQYRTPTLSNPDDRVSGLNFEAGTTRAQN